jgi:ABC-type transporter Mla subunit MlaD
MEKINTIEIESAFYDLIGELEKIKNLNEIAASYQKSATQNKDVADTLSIVLTQYYEHASAIEKNLVDYHQRIATEIKSTKDSFEESLLNAEIKIEEFQKKTDKNIRFFRILLIISIILSSAVLSVLLLIK